CLYARVVVREQVVFDDDVGHRAETLGIEGEAHAVVADDVVDDAGAVGGTEGREAAAASLEVDAGGVPADAALHGEAIDEDVGRLHDDGRAPGAGPVHDGRRSHRCRTRIHPGVGPEEGDPVLARAYGHRLVVRPRAHDDDVSRPDRGDRGLDGRTGGRAPRIRAVDA